ncbi:MAG: TIGR02206 family membrane protein [Anaerolineae bacterium]
MERFFAGDYAGPAFDLFGPAHLAALAALVLLNVILLRFRGSEESVRRRVRWVMALTLWVAETSWQLWNYLTGRWSAQFMLPLNVCSALIWLSGFMLIFKQRTIYDFAYFVGIGGAIQYLATPDLGIYGFPHFRFFQTFISHGLLVTAAIYMTAVEGFRPTWKSLWRVVIVTNVYLVLVYFVNLALGSDYLMINAKPATASLLDLLPPWPYYIAYLEVLGLLTFLVLYLPFAIRDRRAKLETAH